VLTTSQRTDREKQRYEEGLQRARYNRILSHTEHYYRNKQRPVLRHALEWAQDRSVLEIGSTAWFPWLEQEQIYPASLNCINLSQKELDKGLLVASETVIKPRFLLMDAQQLSFADAQFDVVFGASILHHLEMSRALHEICRVLKADGRIVFREPLAWNPVAKLVRLLTPQARTADEQPFRRKELAEIERRFAVQYHYEQLLAVPAGVMSQVLYESPENLINRVAFQIDETLLRLVPGIGLLYRTVVLVGRKRDAAM
jgi:ubiquinone/menaquinone biosynthesis C-methylase UbiE